MSPTVSVVIPTYNRRAYVQEAIDSVLAQTYRDFEIIVVDDGSTDGTGEALAACYGDRITYLWQENQGESVARNRAIDLARGEFIAFLDSDDVWLPEKLARQVPVLKGSPGAVLVGAEAAAIDKDGHPIERPPYCHGWHERPPTLESLLLHEQSFPPSLAVVRRSAVAELGGFDAHIRYGEDWELWLRLRQLGPFVFLPETLTRMREHQNSQWNAPRPETVDQRLDTQLEVISRLIRSSRDRLAPGLHQRAMASAYGDFGLIDCAIGRYELAADRLARALDLDPPRWGNAPYLARRLLDELRRVSAAPTEATPRLVLRLLRIYRSWPTGQARQRQLRDRVCSEMCLVLGFTAYRERDLARVRACILLAAAADHSVLRNRGVVSILARSVLGPAVAQWVATLLRSVASAAAHARLRAPR